MDGDRVLKNISGARKLRKRCVMSRIAYTGIVVGSLTALFLLIAYWLVLPSRFAGDPVGPTSVMELPAKSSACDLAPSRAKVPEAASTTPKSEPAMGICEDDWITGWNVPVYNCDALFGPA